MLNNSLINSSYFNTKKENIFVICLLTRIPHIIAGKAINFPINVVGTMSPYPVVVIVTITNQNADGILSKELNNCKTRKLKYYQIYNMKMYVFSYLGYPLLSTNTCFS